MKIMNYFEKFNKLLVIIVLIMIFQHADLSAQKKTYPKHQFGIAYSSFSGTGLNYQIELNQSSAVQLGGIVYYYGDNPPDDLDFYTILGAEYQHSIIKQGNTRIYGFLGGSYLNLEQRRVKRYVINDREIVEKNIISDEIINLGAGVGIEYKILPAFAISGSVGMLHQISDNTSFSEFWDRSPDGTTYTGFGVSIAIRYVF